MLSLQRMKPGLLLHTGFSGVPQRETIRLRQCHRVPCGCSLLSGYRSTGYQTVSLILLLTITLLSLRLHAGPVLLAATLSAAIWDFFFIPPLFTIHVDQPVDMLMLVTYFMIAIVTGCCRRAADQVKKPSGTGKNAQVHCLV